MDSLYDLLKREEEKKKEEREERARERALSPKKLQGVAALSPSHRRRISRKGGKAVHKKGVGRQWTKEETIEQGRRGGVKSGESRRKKRDERS